VIPREGVERIVADIIIHLLISLVIPREGVESTFVGHDNLLLGRSG